MKPDWDKLAKEFDGHATTLVADVDCTAGGKPLCDKAGVRGYAGQAFGLVLPDFRADLRCLQNSERCNSLKQSGLVVLAGHARRAAYGI